MERRSWISEPRLRDRHPEAHRPRIRLRPGPHREHQASTATKDATGFTERSSRVGHEHVAHAAHDGIGVVIRQIDGLTVEPPNVDIIDVGHSHSASGKGDHAFRYVADNDAAPGPYGAREPEPQLTCSRTELHDRITGPWIQVRNEPLGDRCGRTLDVVVVLVPRLRHRRPIERPRRVPLPVYNRASHRHSFLIHATYIEYMISLTDMVRAVKRKYDSTRRREQARRTRREILIAARELFISRGYGATTMTEIAAEASVSVEMVYAAFGTKPNLLKKVWDVTIGGDDEEVPFHERPEVLEMRAEKNLARRLEMYAALIAHHIAPRTIPFLRALEGAAGTEPEARAMIDEMDRQRLAGMTLAARELAQSEGLAVSEEEARDVLWATNQGALWHHFVVLREWDPERFAKWLGDLWKRMLLTPDHH